MNRIDFEEKVVYPTLEIIKALLTKKGAEYSGNDDVFKSFNDGFLFSHTDNRKKHAWELLTKHLVSLKTLIQRDAAFEKVSMEMLDEKILDIIAYAILIKGMFMEEELNLEKTFDKLKINESHE